MWPRVEAAEILKPWVEAKGGKLQGGFSSPTLTFAKRPGSNQRNWHRNTIWQQTWVEQAGQERGKRRCGKGLQAGFPSLRKAANFKTSKHLGNRQARNVAKAAVAKVGSCRGGVFKPWIGTKGGSCRRFFKPCVEVLTKGTGIETPFGNRRGWKREGLRQQAGQERGKSRCGKGGVFFKPPAVCARPQTALSNVIY